MHRIISTTQNLISHIEELKNHVGQGFSTTRWSCGETCTCCSACFRGQSRRLHRITFCLHLHRHCWLQSYSHSGLYQCTRWIGLLQHDRGGANIWSTDGSRLTVVDDTNLKELDRTWYLGLEDFAHDSDRFLFFASAIGFVTICRISWLLSCGLESNL